MHIQNTHPYYKKQEKKLSQLSFTNFAKGLPEIFRLSTLKVANIVFDSLISYPLSFLSEEKIGIRAGVSKRTVSEVIRLMKKAGLIISCRRYMTTNLCKVGSYFRFYAKETLAHIFPALTKKTAYYFKFFLISTSLITNINVINYPTIYKTVRSNTSKDLLRREEDHFSDPPLPKPMPFIPQGAKHNEPLLNQAIAKKQKEEMMMTIDEANYKLNSYLKIQHEATHPSVIDLCNREIPKWRAIIYELSSNGEG